LPDIIQNESDLSRHRPWSITLALVIATFLATSREFKLRTAANRSRTQCPVQASLSNMPHGLSMFDREQKLVICNERLRRDVPSPAGAHGARHGAGHDLEARVEAGCAPPTAKRSSRAACASRRGRAGTTFLELAMADHRDRFSSRRLRRLPRVHQDITQQKASESQDRLSGAS